jgi:hypothetical protein
MNKDGIKKLIELLQATLEGKSIQLRYPDGKWTDHHLVENLFEYIIKFPEGYRIKPEPRTFWVCELPGGGVSYAYKSEQRLKEAYGHTTPPIVPIELIEKL